jgi:hypothetical protein
MEMLRLETHDCARFPADSGALRTREASKEHASVLH